MYDSLLLKAVPLVSKGVKQHHVAFILKGNTPIVIGVNKPKTHPKLRSKGYRPMASHIHAELDAVIKLGKLLDKPDFSCYTMIVLRVGKRGEAMYSKPCPGCAHLLTNLGFKAIYYSTGLGFEELEQDGSDDARYGETG